MSRLMLSVVAGMVFGCAQNPAPTSNTAEDKTVTVVEKLGGYVKRDDKSPGKPAIGVSLPDRATDAEIKEVATLTSLKELSLGGTKVTDAGLKELAALKNLTHLNLRFTQVTDAGLKELAARGQFTVCARSAGIRGGTRETAWIPVLFFSTPPLGLKNDGRHKLILGNELPQSD